MKAAVEPVTLTPEEIRALPAVTSAEATICAVWGIRSGLYFKLLGAGQLPVPTHQLGRKRVVYRADILRALSEDTNEHGDGAGAATPTPLAETHNPTSSDQ
ncbi:hypothetical protein [Streptomyces sp. NBC_01477]|uniref:hypothetical protein n=1 Tax=Streptomyces sp. NBC_01477 TaxID=2976015 RepID=UPI002E380AD6|nr:hypothetical protein [Streptomyces sp. NBC_01477]